jgi:hypothetical protein
MGNGLVSWAAFAAFFAGLVGCGGHVRESDAASGASSTSFGAAGKGGDGAISTTSVGGSIAGAAGRLDMPFVVSDYFSPVTLVGDAATPGRLEVHVNDQCKPRPPGARGDCYRFDYRPGDIGWVGVYWTNPNDGPQLIGRPFSPGNIRAVSWSAATEQAPQTLMFYVGGLGGDKTTPPSPHVDQIDTSALKTVTQDFQHFEMPFSPIDPSMPVTTLIGAFGWTLGLDNPAGSVYTVYIDDLVYE